MRRFSAGAMLAFTALSPLQLQADDIEIYVNSATEYGPNVLFAFDLSGSMNWLPDVSAIADEDETSRFDILKEALQMTLSDDLGALNIGLSWYGGYDFVTGYNNYASGPKWPISSNSASASEIDPDITGDDSVSDTILNMLEAQTPYGGTPIVEALYEAALYFSGGTVGQGAAAPQTWDSTVKSYTGSTPNAAHFASYTPENAFTGGGGTATYISPIKSSCQSNYLVLLSDGIPNHLTNQAEIESFIGKSCADQSQPGGIMDGVTAYNHAANCGPELAEYLATEDQVASMSGSNVNVITIGFALDDSTEGQVGRAFLETVAEAGGGDFYEAAGTTDLATVLSTIVNEVNSSSNSFTAASVSIDTSKMSTDERSFFGLFEPAHSRAWVGNLKGYFVGNDGYLDVDGNEATVLGDDGLEFSDTARSFWSGSADGAEVVEGGANYKLDYGNRNFYTWLGSSAELTDESNALAASNTALSAEDLGVSGSAEVSAADLLDWLQDQPMGDPLHSQPVLVNYDGRDVIYIGTNQGFVHAIDGTTPTTVGDYSGGEEIFAFMPAELLSNVYPLYRNLAWGGHIYGMDGDITVYHDDDNGDGIVNDSDTVTLIAGMRRGGRAYYALDVTDPDKPEYKWQIDPTVDGYGQLGQTWSRPVLTTLDDRKVLIFGGGYDPAEDDKSVRSADTMGNAVYVADADTGELIWSLSSAEGGQVEADLKYAVPTALRVVDMDANGSADRIYFGDTGGQLWRVDLDEEDLSSSSGATVTKLADFNDGSASGNRKFFYPPAVALTESGGDTFLSVAIGSGNRSHPLSTTVENRIYVYRDMHVDKGAPSETVDEADESDLFDATDNDIGEGDASTSSSAEEELAASQGWYVTLSTGQKVLAEGLIYDNSVMFTTFEPADTDEDSCSTPSSLSYFVKMSLTDATPTSDLDGSGDDSNLTASDRFYELDSYGIPSQPSLSFPAEGSSVQVYVGRQMVEDVSPSVRTVFWRVEE
ncbi:PilC/PilY family type IV pilus protein [Granulosicoccaceae sp. 1_MG-2023]|nr:PilC/PilY family type IV pilus protein [Granulosicoccaceae sp. 1_MG-2023]